MAHSIDPHDRDTIEALASSGMWERAGLIEACRLQELLKQHQNLDALTALRHESPRAETPQGLPSNLSQLTNIERELLGDILTLFDDEGITREQTLALLGQVSVLIELVKQEQAKEPTKRTS